MSKRHRRHSTARKREVVEAYFNGETMRGLSQRYDVCRTLIPIWVEKYERGEFDEEVVEGEVIQDYEARIAADIALQFPLERRVCRPSIHHWWRKHKARLTQTSGNVAE